MKDEIKILVAVCASILILFASIITPLVYLKGSAKSKWLKITRNVDMPWYQANFIDIKYSDIEGNFKIENK